MKQTGGKIERAKMRFDGNNRQIILSDNITHINVNIIYDAWKEWACKHLQFVDAMRFVGGEALPGGATLAKTFFMINGWTIKYGPSITLVGNLFIEQLSLDPNNKYKVYKYEI